VDGSRLNYAVVGGFVLLVLIAAIATLAGLSGWMRDTNRYVTVFRNVVGINEGTRVLYEGYPIGRVTGIRRLTVEQAEALFGAEGGDGRARFRVDFEVGEKWTIESNAEARILATGLLAAASINIVASASPADAPPRELDGIPVIPGRDGENLFSKADTLVDALQPLVGSVEQSVTQQVGPAFAELGELAALLTRELPPILRQVEGFANTMNDVADALRQVAGIENRRHIEATMRNFDAASANLMRLTAKTDRLLTGLNGIVDGNREDIEQSIKSLRYVLGALARDIDSINRNVEGAARNMHEFSREIRKNPGLLLGGGSTQDPAPRRDGRR
jgi:phospholipid/cholesterol/gamma-HCH transport system substrate-binding protein